MNPRNIALHVLMTYFDLGYITFINNYISTSGAAVVTKLEEQVLHSEMRARDTPP